MTSLAPLLSSLLFPVLGGITLGFIAGVFTTLYWIGRRRERGLVSPVYNEAEHPKGRPVRSGDHFTVFGWVLLVLSVAGLVAGSVSIFQTTAQARCLAQFASDTAATSIERAKAAATDRAAIRQQRQVTREFNRLMIDAVTHPVTDPAGQAKARDDFLAKAQDWDARLAEVDRLDQAAEQQRQNNPLPVSAC